MDFKTRQCAKITADSSALSEDAVIEHLNHLSDWKLNRSDAGFHLKKTFEFGTFEDTMQFITQIGEAAADQRHFPNFETRSKQATITWWSPALEGLHINDFIMAAQTDDIYERLDIYSGERDAVEEASDESFPASDPPAW